MNDRDMNDAIAALLDARRGNALLDISTLGWAPANEAQAYAIQAGVSTALGAIGGWKIGAREPDGPATFAPLAAVGVLPSPATLLDRATRLRGIEVEVGYRLSHDLPPRGAGYSTNEVAGAIDAVLITVEVVESRFTDREAAGPLWGLADHQSHGELIHGEPRMRWSDAELEEVAVELTFGAKVMVNRRCRNAGGHPMQLVTRLANLVGEHCGGLKAGQIVTTGSLTGIDLAPAGGEVHASIRGLGEVSCRFHAD